MKDEKRKDLDLAEAMPKTEHLLLSRRNLLAASLTTAAVATLPANHASAREAPAEGSPVRYAWEYAYVYAYV
jgi:hypothetical protein